MRSLGTHDYFKVPHRTVSRKIKLTLITFLIILILPVPLQFQVWIAWDSSVTRVCAIDEIDTSFGWLEPFGASLISRTSAETPDLND